MGDNMETLLVIFLISVYCIMSYGYMFSLIRRLRDSRYYGEVIREYGEKSVLRFMLFLYIFSPISAIYFYGIQLENS